MPAAYKMRITRKRDERKMEFETFHNPIGAFRRKADYNDEKGTTVKITLPYHSQEAASEPVCNNSEEP